MTVGYVTCGSAGALSPSSPKGANRIPSFSCSPPSGTVVGVVFCFPQVPFPPVIPPAVIESSPPSGTGGLDAALRGLDAALRGLDAALGGLDAALRRLDAALRRFY